MYIHMCLRGNMLIYACPHFCQRKPTHTLAHICTYVCVCMCVWIYISKQVNILATVKVFG